MTWEDTKRRKINKEAVKLKHWYIKPDKELADYVKTILVIENFSKPAFQNHPIFTEGMPALFCRTEKDENTGFERVTHLTLYGTSAPAECWNMNDKTTIVACFLKSFVLPALFNISAKELKGKPIEFCKLSPHEFNALKTQLAYANSTKRKIEILQSLINGRIDLNSRNCDIVKVATEHIMYHPEINSFSEIIDQLHLTERTFQRIFKKFVGITPTQYRRICQFQLSFGQLRSKQFTKVSDVAFDNNFSDQSHFIRTFKEFSQTTPNDYLRNGLKRRDE